MNRSYHPDDSWLFPVLLIALVVVLLVLSGCTVPRAKPTATATAVRAFVTATWTVTPLTLTPVPRVPGDLETPVPTASLAITATATRCVGEAIIAQSGQGAGWRCEEK